MNAYYFVQQGKNNRMMSKFKAIIGPSNSGKSRYARECLSKQGENQKITFFYPTQHQLVESLSQWLQNKGRMSEDFWDLCGFRLTIDPTNIYYFDKNLKETPIKIVSHDSCFSEIPGGYSMIINMISLLRLGVRQYNTHKRDDVVGVLDKTLCNNFFDMVNFVIPHNLQSKFTINFVTHSPDFIGSYISYCRDNKNEHCKLTRFSANNQRETINILEFFLAE